jgi:hypothetical protein
MAEKSFHISRSTEVAAPADHIQPLLVDFHAWRTWSPWEDMDPQMTREYTGPGSGVGSVYTWSGNRRAGSGRMEVVDADPLHVGIDLVFSAPMRAHNRVEFTLRPAGTGSTVVEWTMTGPQNAVMRLMSRFWSMEKMIGPDLEKGLARLKTAAEAA